MRGLLAPLIKLGVFIVVTVLFTAILGISIQSANFGDADSYTARFSGATRLIPGDNVRIAGVQVGQVTSVEVVDRRIAQVKFDVDTGLSLPQNVRAAIRYRNLIGQRYLELSRPAGASDGALKPGEVIPLKHTTPPVSLTLLFNGFKPLFTALSPKDVNKLSYEIIQVLQGEGGTVESLLRHTASLTKKIAAKDRVIGEVITNLNDVLDTINKRTPELNNLITRLQELVSGLASDRAPIGEAIQKLGNLAQVTSGFLDDAREPLRKDIDALGDLASNLNDHEDVVEHFIQFLPEKTQKLTRTVSYGSWFNFFACRVTLSFAPGNSDNIPLQPVTRERCGA